MHYVCIENNTVVGIQSYEPAVPASVTVVPISDHQHQQLIDQTHIFDTVSKSVAAVDTGIISQRQQDILNGIQREFLNSTDWKVLRHIRQKALAITMSLSDAEYKELEQRRQAAADRIV